MHPSMDVADDAAQQELVLYDAGIESLARLVVRGQRLQDLQGLCSLKLHNNNIRRIEGLDRLYGLRVLDLSSNAIAQIEGLQSLTALVHLNLSANQLTHLQNLTGLRSLRKLNVSYNRIEELSGLAGLAGGDYDLVTLDVRGNRVADLQQLAHLHGLAKLSTLFFAEDARDGNTVAQHPDFHRVVFSTVPSLKLLDGLDEFRRPGSASVDDAGK